MKLAGDLSEAQKLQIPELIEFETMLDNDICYPNEGRAMMYTCLAHDWYQLDMEEEGHRLLIKADAICPGYFTGPIVNHILENPKFDYLVKNLTKELLDILTGTLRK